MAPPATFIDLLYSLGDYHHHLTAPPLPVVTSTQALLANARNFGARHAAVFTFFAGIVAGRFINEHNWAAVTREYMAALGAAIAQTVDALGDVSDDADADVDGVGGDETTVSDT